MNYLIQIEEGKDKGKKVVFSNYPKSWSKHIGKTMSTGGDSFTVLQEIEVETINSQNRMTNLLKEAKLITAKEYCKLPGTPEFVGQTRADENGMYYMVSRSEGVLYKTHNRL